MRTSKMMLMMTLGFSVGWIPRVAFRDMLNEESAFGYYSGYQSSSNKRQNPWESV
jgi:hypothetical protein